MIFISSKKTVKKHAEQTAGAQPNDAIIAKANCVASSIHRQLLYRFFIFSQRRN